MHQVTIILVGWFWAVTCMGANRTDWMQNLPDQVKQRPIGQLKLLGSHDSGSYALNLTATPSMERTTIMDWAKEMAQESPELEDLLKQVTLTQQFDLLRQLEQGIRALDLRITYNSDIHEFFVSHSFTAIPLRLALEQIRDFLLRHRGELLVIQMQDDAEHFYRTRPYNDQAVAMVRSILGDWLIPVTNDRQLNSIMTLKNLVDSNHRVLLSFMDPLQQTYSDIWPRNIVQVYWPDGQNATESIGTIQTYVPSLERPLNTSMNLVFFTVTPNEASIVGGMLGQGLCGDVPASIYQWALEMNAASKSFLNKTFSKLSGLNILSVDFPTDDFVDWVVSWNTNVTYRP